MSLKPAMFLPFAPVGTGLIASSITAQAGSMTHIGTWGGVAGKGAAQNGLFCDMPITVNHPRAMNVGPVNFARPNAARMTICGGKIWRFAREKTLAGRYVFQHPELFLKADAR